MLICSTVHLWGKRGLLEGQYFARDWVLEHHCWSILDYRKVENKQWAVFYQTMGRVRE